MLNFVVDTKLAHTLLIKRFNAKFCAEIYFLNLFAIVWSVCSSAIHTARCNFANLHAQFKDFKLYLMYYSV